MKTLGHGSVAFGAILTVFALTASPVFASGSHGGGGGGGHGFSGGHSFGGHSFSGGHVFSGAHAFATPHAFAGARFSGSRIAASTPAYRAGYAVNNGYALTHTSPSGGRTVGGSYARPGVGYGGGGGRYGGRGGYYGRWGGGYWHGGYWPPVFWGAGFAWFLPVLPAFCATYWWNSVPYYYYNDVYYTYDPAASGYVVTTPPPAADAEAAAGDNAGAGPGPAPGAPANSDRLYAYPKNGQSDEQQSTDRNECARWAASQTGSNAAATDSPDYRRAESACLQGRGYSVN